MYDLRILLFLHGFGTDGKIWSSQLKAFSKNYQILTPDLDLSNLDFEAKRIINLFLKGNLPETVIIGWSMGAFLALKIYFQIPERIRGLILVGATPKFVKEATFPYGVSKALLRNLERKIKKDYRPAMNFFYDLMFNLKKPKKEIPGLNPPEYDVALKCLEELKNSDVRDELSKIAVPTLILHGERDEISPLEAAKYLKNRISQSQLIIFEKEGHAPFITQPEKFNRICVEFLNMI